MIRLALIVMFASACAAETPADAAKAWFSAAASGDASRMAAQVDPRCADAPVGEGVPAHILGMQVDVEDLALVTTSATARTATVAYSFRGEVHKERETHEVERAGADLTVTTPAHDVDMGGKSGNLSLIRVDGDWKVTCAFAALRSPS